VDENHDLVDGKIEQYPTNYPASRKLKKERRSASAPYDNSRNSSPKEEE